MAVQTTFGRDPVELYYCIHCNWKGFDVVKAKRIIEGGDFFKDRERVFHLCPKCEWVCYSDSEVRESHLNSNVYPKLAEKYRKVHRMRAHP